MIVRLDYVSKWGSNNICYDTSDPENKQLLLKMLSSIKDGTHNLYDYEFFIMAPIHHTVLLDNLT